MGDLVEQSFFKCKYKNTKAVIRNTLRRVPGLQRPVQYMNHACPRAVASPKRSKMASDVAGAERRCPCGCSEILHIHARDSDNMSSHRPRSTRPIPESVLLVTSGRACQAPVKFDEANAATPRSPRYGSSDCVCSSSQDGLPSGQAVPATYYARPVAAHTRSLDAGKTSRNLHPRPRSYCQTVPSSDGMPDCTIG
jgi:hypothetical protein